MSKSVKISHHNQLINHTTLVHHIAQELCVSEQTVSNVLNKYHETITEQLIQGNAVKVLKFATFHIRRRDYPEERRNKFAIGGGAGSLPEFCYYPYAEMSTVLRKEIAAHKYEIAKNIGE